MTTFVEKFNATYRKPHRFRDELKRHGFKQAAVAGFLGVHTSYLCNMLAGLLAPVRKGAKMAGYKRGHVGRWA